MAALRGQGQPGTGHQDVLQALPRDFRQDLHPSAGEIWRQQSKGRQGLKCRPQCLSSLELRQDLPRCASQSIPVTPIFHSHGSQSSWEHPLPPQSIQGCLAGSQGAFQPHPTQHRARTRGQPPPAPVPPPPSPQAPRERPVVIFTLRSSALLTTHVWLRPPPGDNIWARTSGGHSSRPPRAAAPAPPRTGMGHI